MTTIPSKPILICSSDATAVEQLRRLLASRTCETVQNSAQALQYVQQHRPDTMLIDMFLPDADVFDFLVQLRGIADDPPRIIVLTGSNGTRLERQQAELGIAGTIRKSADWEVMKREVARFFPGGAMGVESGRATSATLTGSSIRTGNHLYAQAQYDHPDRNAILLIEDSRETARAVEMLLGLSGYDVTTAPTAERALQLIPRISCNLLLLDLGLPGMDGVELLARIRHEGRRIPCIVITGNRDKHDPELLEELGVDAVFEKPADFATIRRTVDSLIDN